MDRRARSDSDQRFSFITRRSGSTEAVEFFNVLTSADLLKTTKASLTSQRERLYPPTVTRSMFMRQTLEAEAFFQKSVNSQATQRAAAVPTHLGVGRLQRHHRMRHHWPYAHLAPRACRYTSGAQPAPQSPPLGACACLAALQGGQARSAARFSKPKH